MRHPFLLVIAIVPTWAYATPSTTTIAEADALFDQGRELMDAGKIAEACSAFEASNQKVPARSTLFRLADCREQNNQLATAYGLFREAERQTRAGGDAKSAQLNATANEHVKTIEPKLSRLLISVPANIRVEGLEIRRGNEVIEPGTWNRPLPIDGGTYTIVVRAPSHADWSKSITIAPSRDAKTIDVPSLVRAPKRAAAQPRSKLVPLLIGGGAAALLGGALVTDLSARSDYDRSFREPDDATQASLFDSAKTKRFAAQGIAVIGVGAAGVAIWLYLRGGRAKEAPSIGRIASFDLEPVVSTTSTGLQLTRRY